MATTLRLGKTHYEALLPQLEEMGWTSADAHQALQATGARDLASAIDWLVARPASGEGGVVEPTPYQAPPAVVVPVPVPASSSLSAPSAALAPVAPAGSAEKSEYERKQRELELRKAREEKRQKEEEQRRIKEHIKDMKLDRARKYNRGGGETTGRAPVPTTSGSAPSTPTPAAASSSAASSSPAALLQIRLPTGATVKHEFASTDTLGAVYEFVSQSTGRDVANFLLLQPGIPKVEYPIETALTTTLAQAELVPRGSITVMNREDKGVVRGAEAEPAMHFRRVRYGHAGSDDDEGELNADAVDTDAMSYEQLLALEERIGEVGKGLSKQVLATLPTFTYDSSVSILGDPMCAFCLSDYDTGNILRKLPCGHAFHKARECVDEWLKGRKTCPTCKQRIDDL